MPTINVPPACAGFPGDTTLPLSASMQTTRNRSDLATFTPRRSLSAAESCAPFAACGAIGRCWDTSLRRDGYRRQILEPALRLHKALHLGRQRARVEVVHDK